MLVLKLALYEAPWLPRGIWIQGVLGVLDILHPWFIFRCYDALVGNQLLYFDGKENKMKLYVCTSPPSA